MEPILNAVIELTTACSFAFFFVLAFVFFLGLGWVFVHQSLMGTVLASLVKLVSVCGAVKLIAHSSK